MPVRYDDKRSEDGEAATLVAAAIEFSWLLHRTSADVRGTLLRLMGEALDERGLPRIARDLKAAATEYPEHVSLRYVHVPGFDQTKDVSP